jgi:RHS repeat-associated protein
MFTGREFDIETGLYYYRARYYNPCLGRFLQTDPIGYEDGINWYQYCGNGPVGRADPSGLYASWNHETWYGFLNWNNKETVWSEGYFQLTFARFHDGRLDKVVWAGNDVNEWCKWAPGFFASVEGWDMKKQVGYALSQRFIDPCGTYDSDWFFWRLQALQYLGSSWGTISSMEQEMQNPRDPAKAMTVNIVVNRTWIDAYGGYNAYSTSGNTITLSWYPWWEGEGSSLPRFPALAGLAHEMSHGADFVWDGKMYPDPMRENVPIGVENAARAVFLMKVPGYWWVQFRPYY